MLTHETKREKLICRLCGVECTTKQTYQKHWTRKHKEQQIESPDKDVRGKMNKEQSYVCEYCAAGFQRKSNLQRHMITHGFTKMGRRSLDDLP